MIIIIAFLLCAFVFPGEDRKLNLPKQLLLLLLLLDLREIVLNNYIRIN